MIILIGGASHTGKTRLAQQLLEKYQIPYLSVDHLKMGLIRSGQTELTPQSSGVELTRYLWPVVREMIKAAAENGQSLIVEGCYIPCDWRKDFSEQHLAQMRGLHIVMSERYIRSHFAAIRGFANVIEQRLDDADCTLGAVLRDNAEVLAACRAGGADFVLIDGEYPSDFGL